jgi:tetratricopeptide (TPR) repeat protein
VDGEIVVDSLGSIVRCEPLTVVLPVDRERLAGLPGQPPPDSPLLCLDTETTGLATASGTVAWLVGLGWWEGDRFRQAQLLLPDYPDEPALLARIAAHLPASGWLVTYNGRGFDWPLLTARYRMNWSDPPRHAGHLDLLPLVRRVFRHRMADARLRTVETTLLGVARHEDVEGWEIPSRYHEYLRGGPADPLLDVVRHNREDVRSLGRLLADVDARFASGGPGRPGTHPGDLAGLSRAYARERRLEEALSLVETALAHLRPAAPHPSASRGGPSAESQDDEIWWRPRAPVDYGGRPVRPADAPLAAARLDSPWTEERILVERARLLRRLGRYADAALAWEAIGAGAGPLSPHAWIEVAKLREHRLGDMAGALEAAGRARQIADRRSRLGRFDPALERALAARLERLMRRRWPAIARA